MTRGAFLSQLASVEPKKLGDGGRAPHKPLLLLLALGHHAQGRPRLMLYRNLEGPMSELLEAYGSPRNRKRAVYPFRWLLTDGVWEIPGFDGLHRNQSGDLRVTELRDRRVKGGFTREVHALLKSKPVLVAEAAYLILSRHFPPSLHGDVLEAVGLAPGSPTWESQEAMPRRGRPVREYLPRDPRFRREVLAAYDDQLRRMRTRYPVRQPCTRLGGGTHSVAFPRGPRRGAKWSGTLLTASQSPGLQSARFGPKARRLSDPDLK